MPHDDILQNYTEATLVYQTVKALVSCGVAEKSIGVITPYRSQVRVLSVILAGHPEVEVFTVDRYQGRDKDCVIVSMVRTTDDRNVGALLRDWRRLNVAFTRARKKLIVFGSQSTLTGSEIFAEFLAMMREHKWIYTLPEQAHRLHMLTDQPELALSLRPQKQRIPRNATLRRSATAGSVIVRHNPLVRDVLNDGHSASVDDWA